MGNWYLIQFKRNSHRIAEQNLNKQGFKTFLPLQEITINQTKIPILLFTTLVFHYAIGQRAFPLFQEVMLNYR